MSIEEERPHAEKIDRRGFLKFLAGAALAAAPSILPSAEEADFLRREREEPGRRSTRLAERSLEYMSKLFDLRVEGAGHLKDIPSGTRIIFATTQLARVIRRGLTLQQGRIRGTVPVPWLGVHAST